MSLWKEILGMTLCSIAIFSTVSLVVKVKCWWSSLMLEILFVIPLTWVQSFFCVLLSSESLDKYRLLQSFFNPKRLKCLMNCSSTTHTVLSQRYLHTAMFPGTGWVLALTHILYAKSIFYEYIFTHMHRHTPVKKDLEVKEDCQHVIVPSKSIKASSFIVNRISWIKGHFSTKLENI